MGAIARGAADCRSYTSNVHLAVVLCAGPVRSTNVASVASRNLCASIALHTSGVRLPWIPIPLCTFRAVKVTASSEPV